MQKHKTLGQVYTPNWIVNKILDLTDYKGENILQKYILEPSCGDGAFLCEIVKRYVEVSKENNISENQVIKDLETYIYGVELDIQEFHKCIENLNNSVREYEITEKINWKIFNKNTLCFYKKHLEKFDFIVGNPPYIRIHNLDVKTRELLKNEFQFSQGTIDIYLSFFEMGFKMLKNDGVLGYITPNSYLHNSSYGAFREYLKRQKTLKTLIDFKANKLFDGYSTYTAISIFKKNNQSNKFEYKELIDSEIKTINEIEFENLNKKDWSFTDKENTEFLKNLQKNRNSSVKDFFDVQYGFATLRDKIFIGKSQEYNDELVQFNGSLVEKKILKTVVKGSRFKGEINENDKILFPYEKVENRYIAITESKLKQQFPNAYAYLLKNKTELEKRNIDKGSLWYEFGRSQGVQSIHNEKIVLSTLVNGSIDFYRVPKDVMMYSGLFITKNKSFSNWEIIEETLSSEEFYKYIRLTGKDFSGGYKSVTSKQIKEFRIKENNPLSLF
ncbi:MAG: Eco57I restriction-modification methylase domain-containing protein [Flavobacteriaceae bacterium]|nr:Eco57I restriction-modification methylase domain-containing protein [Flavobacteriaceae bacterium]